MTKTEAIDLLDNLVGMVEDNQENDYDEALKMAIEALRTIEKQQHDGCLNCDHFDVVRQIQWERDTAIQQLKELGYGLGEKIRTDGDTISRQAAIDACLRMEAVTGYDAGCLIAQLPPAQPERKVGEWIVVKRHEHYPSGKPDEQVQCPYCKRFDHNGDGNYCGYCGADMRGEQE